MSTLTLRFHGVQDRILNAMIESGVAKTKSEAVRMAVLKFGFDTGIMNSSKILTALQESLAPDELSEEEILKGISEARA